MNKFDFLNKTWWISYGINTLYFGVADYGEKIVSGQPNLELYDNESEWELRVIELGGDPYPSEFPEIIDYNE